MIMDIRSDESNDLRWFEEAQTFPANISVDIPRMFEKWKTAKL
jgi:hypothetical protein